MKYVITENRLNKIIFKYLDMDLSGIEQKKGKYYDVIFKLPNEKYGILGWDKPGFLGIYYKIINDISNLFGTNESDSEEVIGMWVKDRYNLEVINTSSFFYGGDTDC
jgi:hypothetical protein